MKSIAELDKTTDDFCNSKDETTNYSEMIDALKSMHGECSSGGAIRVPMILDEDETIYTYWRVSMERQKVTNLYCIMVYIKLLIKQKIIAFLPDEIKFKPGKARFTVFGFRCVKYNYNGNLIEERLFSIDGSNFFVTPKDGISRVYAKTYKEMIDFLDGKLIVASTENLNKRRFWLNGKLESNLHQL